MANDLKNKPITLRKDVTKDGAIKKIYNKKAT